MANFGQIIPLVLPLATLLWIRTTDHDYPMQRNDWFTEYDYIVVGGGSAGAVVANRLSEVSNWKILLLEAGGSESILSDIPIAAATLQMTPIDWAYQTEPQEASCFGLINRRSRWPRGRVLGGSSVLNYMLYIRGNARDYDKWDSIGATGWSWADVFPYFIKSEDNRDPAILSNGFHGRGGYLTVSSPPDSTLIGKTFAQAGKYLGYPNIDLNGPLQSGFAIPQGTIRRGARCSTSKAFLKPARGRSNLHVLTFAYATKILFSANKRAVGIQFDRFSLSYTVFARREIILSAGSINTPQLLMLSGIGPAEHLKSLKIPVIANLPVGNNLIDHIYPGVHFTIDPPVSLVQRRVVTLPNILKYFTTGRGPLTALGGVEGLGFIKTKYANMSDDYPDFQIHLLSGSPTSDDGQTFRRVQGITREMWTKYYRQYLPYDTFSLYPVLLRPKSRGYIRLRSRNPYEPPIIDPRYLTHPDDIRGLVEAMKICIAVGLTPDFRRINSRLFDAIVPGCEIYSTWSNQYLACMARTYTSTIYHPVGTARMGSPDDPRSVVDPYLRVLGGVKNLRIADGSVMPEIITGNTNAPIIMIAERLADFIKGQRLPRFRPPVAGQHSQYMYYLTKNHMQFTRRSDNKEESINENKQDFVLSKTNYEFVDEIMNTLKTNNADHLLSSQSNFINDLETSSTQRTSSLFTSQVSNSSSTQNQNSIEHSKLSRSFNYISLLERLGLRNKKSTLEKYSPVTAKFKKQKHTLGMMKELQQFVGSLSKSKNYSSRVINSDPEVQKINNFYSHLIANQTYSDKEIQQIMFNLKRLLKLDKMMHPNQVYEHTNEPIYQMYQTHPSTQIVSN